MNEHRIMAAIRRLWQELPWHERLTILLCIGAVGSAIGGIIGGSTVIYLSSILFLVSTFVLYAFYFMHQTEKKLEVLHFRFETVDKIEGQLISLTKALSAIGKLELIRKPDDVFDYGCSAIEEGKTQGGWDMVRIYAPIGISDPSKAKDRWLETLQFELGTKTKDFKGGGVTDFRAMYGLPSASKEFDDYAEKRLNLFRETNNTEIHYLPPEDTVHHPSPAQGVGTIIFENRRYQRYVVIFAYVGKATDDTIQRSGYVLKDSDAGRLLADWFDYQVFEGCSRAWVLKGRDPNNRNKWVDFDKEMAKIRRYYHPE